MTIKMVTAKSLVTYKIGYNPDGRKKHKSVEVAFKNGATQTFEIPIVSGEKDIEFQANEQLPLYDGLAEALIYTGPEKFSHYRTYLSRAFKLAWENELNDNYQNANQRIILGFCRALQATWIRFYGESDLRKGGLN